MNAWEPAQRRELQRAAAADAPLTCPACGGTVSRSRVDPPPGVAYVRRRLLLVCAGCRRSAAIDLPPGR
ncbi:MAG TPA: hypothetical protein VK939_12560 [Longimicrobiales bacterium]|nr:hypothetical protein [Longimicrobiales bacterium]